MPNYVPPDAPSSPHSRAGIYLPVAVKIAGIYLFAGFLWIFASDRWLNLLLHDRLEIMTQLQTVKGLFYIVMTAGMLYWLIDREARVNRHVTTTLQQTLAELLVTREGLQASEERYRRIVETQIDFVMRSTADTTITFANPTLCRALGQSAEQVVGLQWRNFVPPEDLNWLNAKIASLCPDRPTFENINPDYRANGEIGWTQWINLGIFDDQGHLLEIQSVGRDITQLRQTEDALRESEERFRAFMDNSPASAWITDSEGQISYASQTYRRMFQVPADLVGQSLLDLYPPAIAQTYLTNIQAVANSGQELETIEPGLRADGRLGQFLVYKFPLPQPDGRLQVGSVAIDVTEWKQSEAALHQREQEFRALAENAPDIIARFDRALRYLYANPAITVATGLLPQALIGKTNRELGLPETLVAQWDDKFTRLWTTGEQQYLEFPFATPQGIREYQARCVPEFAADGSVASILAVARDITEQKQLEQALRQQAERLELTIAIAQHIRQSLDLKEILNTTVVEVKQWLQADRVIIYQFAADMSGTVLAEAVAAGWRVSLGNAIADTCFQTGAGTAYRKGKKRAIANIYDAGLTACHLQLLERFEVKANLVVPILLMGMNAETPAHLWGLLIAHQCASPREWQSDQLDSLEQIALQLAIAIQQAQIYSQAQRELAERQQAETYLRAALTEKEVLLKEIHHRVKNNLQIVSGLLQLQAQGLSDPKVVNALKESQNRIESMSLIHKKLYTSSDLGQIDAADYIQSLAVSLLTTYQISPGAVALYVAVEPVILSLDQAIPCGLIINELVSNALKYAFPDNYPGEINVKLCKIDDRLELMIQDNGVGLPEHLNWQNAQSLGLSLVYALSTEQLDGCLNVDRSSGTQFTISFPSQHPKNSTEWLPQKS